MVWTCWISTKIIQHCNCCFCTLFTDPHVTYAFRCNTSLGAKTWHPRCVCLSTAHWRCYSRASSSVDGSSLGYSSTAWAMVSQSSEPKWMVWGGLWPHPLQGNLMGHSRVCPYLMWFFPPLNHFAWESGSTSPLHSASGSVLVWSLSKVGFPSLGLCRYWARSLGYCSTSGCQYTCGMLTARGNHLLCADWWSLNTVCRINIHPLCSITPSFPSLHHGLFCLCELHVGLVLCKAHSLYELITTSSQKGNGQFKLYLGCYFLQCDFCFWKNKVAPSDHVFSFEIICFHWHHFLIFGGREKNNLPCFKMLHFLKD